MAEDRPQAPGSEIGRVRSLAPTLLLGLGGTGKEVMLRLRKRFYERYGEFGFPTVGYLWIDTDTSNTNIDGQPLDHIMQQVMFKQEERVNADIPGEAFMGYFQDQRAHPHIFNWLDSKLAAQGQVLNGAGQVRPLGRLAFFHRYPDIRQKVEAISARIGQQTPVEEMLKKHAITVDGSLLDIVLICSIAGGTGGGMFLDAAFMCRQAFPHAKITFYILLPTAFADWIKGSEKIYANAYAALKELEYYSLRKDVLQDGGDTNGGAAALAASSRHDFKADWDNSEAISGAQPRAIPAPPFNTCYLIDNVTQSGGAIGPKDKAYLCDMIAENIFLNFSSEEFSREKDSIRSNLEQYLGEPLTYKYQRGEYTEIFSQRFSAFGFSKLFVPVDRIRYACSFQLGLDILGSWLARNEPSAIEVERRLLDKELPKLGVRAGTSGDDFTAELNKVGERTFDDEIRDWINVQRSAFLQEAAKEKQPGLYTRIPGALKAFVNKNYDKTDARWENWGLFVKSLELNRERCITMILGEFGPSGKRKSDGKILSRVRDWLRDDHVRVDLAVEYLKVLGKILDRHVDEYYTRAKEAADRRARASLDDIKIKLEMVRDEEGGWLVQRRALRALVEHICNRMREHLTARMNSYVYAAAIEIIKGTVRPYIGGEDIKTDAHGREVTDRRGLILELWLLKESLSKMRSELDERFRSFEEVSEHLIYENLYEKGLFRSYYLIEENGLLYPVSTRLEQQEGLLLERLGIANPYDLKALIARRGPETTRREIEDFCYSRFKELEVNVDVLQKFRDKYQSDDQRNQQLARLVANASVRLQKSKQAEILKQVKRYDAALISKSAASTEDDSMIYEEIWSLLHAGGYQNVGYKTTSRADSVFVYTEYAGFPLAFIRNLQRYRDEAYVPLINEGTPLHLDYHDERFTDVLVKDHQEVERTLQANSALLVGAIVRAVAVSSDGNGNAVFSFSRLVSGLPRTEPLGTESVAIETLKRNKPLLDAIETEINKRRAMLSNSKPALQRFYTVLNYHVVEKQDPLGLPAGPFARTHLDTSMGGKTTMSPEWRAIEQVREQIFGELVQALGTEEAVAASFKELYQELDGYSEQVTVNGRRMRLMKEGLNR
jgi:hypothetical protein